MSRITVFGAGAMGTLYAARLASAGHTVAIVARGARKAAIEREGLRIRARRSAQTLTVRVPVVERIEDGGAADVVLVLVRRQQLDEVLPLLVRQPRDVAMMVNVASGYGAWREALGARLLVGFPGATGSFSEDGVLVYEIAPRLLQPTVLGEPDGPPTVRVRALASALRRARFPVQLRSDMSAWQRTHAAWMTPFMLTAAAAGGDPDRFAARASVRRWIDTMREAISSLRAQGVRPSPGSIRLLAALPPPLLAGVVRGVLLASRPLRTHVLSTGTASAAEGRALARELLEQVQSAGGALPSLEALVRAAEAAR